MCTCWHCPVWALPRTRAVAFEDTVHGMAAAKEAGLRCVAIPHPHADPALFTAADVLLTTASNIPLASVVAKVG